jgi:hypothetical protein
MDNCIIIYIAIYKIFPIEIKFIIIFYERDKQFVFYILIDSRQLIWN